MRSNAQAAIDWAAAQVKHPSQDWAHKCLRSVRVAWGLPVIADSATHWWAKVPAAHRHRADHAKGVPPGALCYAPLGQYGHAWLMGHNGHAFSTDYFHRGRIDAVYDGALQHWTHTPRVWWTDWTPAGKVPLG